MTEDAQANAGRSREEIQESEYGFPYHYVPRLTSAGFEQSITMRWGYLYWSYLGVVLDLLKQRAPAAVLDIGCGDGRLLAEVSRRLPGTRVVGVDTSDRAVALARAMHPSGDFRAGDVTAPGLLDESFDAITLIEVLEHIPPHQLPVLQAAVLERLAPGGRLVVTVPTKNLGMHPKHYQHFDLATLEAALAPAFDLEEPLYLNRQSRVAKLVDRLVTNRFFAIREPRLLGWLFDIYTRRFLRATPANAMRICAVFKPHRGD